MAQACLSYMAELALKTAFIFTRFHRFLDVNSHKIQKTIDGYVESLYICIYSLMCFHQDPLLSVDFFKKIF